MNSSHESDRSIDEDKVESYEFDELLTQKVGEFGRRQILLSMLLVSSGTWLCLQTLSSVFTAG